MTFSRGPAQTAPEESTRIYNLFRNKQRLDLLCAVPEDCPVPGFLGPEQWTFEQVLRPSDARPSGFNDRGASAGVRFNGFYLFQLTSADTKTTVPSEEAVRQA